MDFFILKKEKKIIITVSLRVSLSLSLSVMDSLLANYASSDEEEAEVQKPQLQSQPSSLFSSLPKPNPKPPSSSSSSLFSSLPPPKHEPQEFQDDEESKPPISRSSLFSSLPKPKLEDPIDSKPPKSQFPKKPQSLSSSSSSQNPKKKVVQFKPPVFVNPTQFDDEDDDDDDEEEERLRRRKAAEASSAQPLSVTSFLSSIPAPRNSATLGVSSGLGSGSGSGRRAIVETEAIVPKVETKTETDVVGVSYPDSESSFDHNAVGYGGYGGGYESYQYGIDQNVESGGAQLQAGFHGNASSYGNYSGYGESEWADGPAAAAAPVEFKGSGKRRRNDVPTEIVEVKQDELMKNRPREDQAKVTGIAFGPSYQPVATKGKPTKLHKRKHQIGSLYFDMKQKEMELTERRSRGFLTKAETQAKYGW